MRIVWVILAAVGLLVGVFHSPAFSTFHHEEKFRQLGILEMMKMSVSDLQGIIAALPVFDMQAIIEHSNNISKRNADLSKEEQIPPPIQERFEKLSESAASITESAREGDLDGILNGLNTVLSSCNECHINVRDLGGMHRHQAP